MSKTQRILMQLLAIFLVTTLACLGAACSDEQTTEDSGNGQDGIDGSNDEPVVDDGNDGSGDEIGDQTGDRPGDIMRDGEDDGQAGDRPGDIMHDGDGQTGDRPGDIMHDGDGHTGDRDGQGGGDRDGGGGDRGDVDTRGHCENAADLAIITVGQADVVAQSSSCYLGCLEDANPVECSNSCIVENTGLTQDCANCYTQANVCVTNLCLPACLNPQSAACISCVEDNCLGIFNDCAGDSIDFYGD
jgi:hypothetical protein